MELVSKLRNYDARLMPQNNAETSVKVAKLIFRCFHEKRTLNSKQSNKISGIFAVLAEEAVDESSAEKFKREAVNWKHDKVRTKSRAPRFTSSLIFISRRVRRSLDSETSGKLGGHRCMWRPA